MISPSTPSRRVLAVLASATTAGCLDRLPLGSADGIRLDGLGIYNRTSEDLTVTIRLERDGDIVHHDTHEVTPENEPVYVDPEWSSDPAEYRLVFHVDGEIQIHEFAAAAEQSEDDGCTVLQVILDSHGHGAILHDESSAGGMWRPCNSVEIS